MTRRIVLAILGVTAMTLAATWIGLAVLTSGDARNRAVEELSDQALVLRAWQENGNDAVDQAVPLLGLEEAVVLPLDARSRTVSGQLPAVLRLADIDVDSLVDGVGRSGVRDDLAFVAIPTVRDGEPSVLVITKRIDSSNGSLPAWLFLASIVAFALGTAVALTISSRIVRPVVDAGDIARQIAAGNVGTRMPQPPPGSSDELARLSRSINDMAGVIETSRDLEREFLMAISHDLRTPLTSIRGYAEALATGAITDVGWATGVIEREADRLDRLVRDLLDLARLDAETFSLDLVSVDLADVAQATVEVMRFRADDAGLDLRIGADSIDTAPVVADDQRLQQIVSNLVDNALKFAESSVVVEVLAQPLGHVAVHVHDDGPGIAPDERAFVFGRHYTASRRQERGEPGTGLGLALVEELTKSFGGTVRADDSELGGAVLVVDLPSAE